MKKRLEQLETSLMDEVIKAGNEIRNEAVAKTPVNTGALRSAWKLRIDRKTFGGSVTVSNETSYAAAVEYGTKPHTITAKNASVLTNGKGAFFGKTVNHPGTPARPMLRPALNKVLPRLLSRLKGL